MKHDEKLMDGFTPTEAIAMGLITPTHRDGLVCWSVLSTRNKAAINRSRVTQACSDFRLEQLGAMITEA